MPWEKAVAIGTLVAMIGTAAWASRDHLHEFQQLAAQFYNAELIREDSKLIQIQTQIDNARKRGDPIQDVQELLRRRTVIERRIRELEERRSKKGSE